MPTAGVRIGEGVMDRSSRWEGQRATSFRREDCRAWNRCVFGGIQRVPAVVATHTSAFSFEFIRRNPAASLRVASSP